QAAELPVELRALREARRTERVTLRDEAAGRIHYPLAAVGDGAGLDQIAALPFGTEAEALVRDELVRREAVVELDHLHVLRPEARLLVDLLRRRARHVLADQLDAALRVERAREVRRHRHAGDLDGLLLEAVLLHELLRRENRRAGAVRRRAALELRQRVEDHRRVLDVVERVLLLKLRVRVVDRVLVVLVPDLRERLGTRAVLLHVLAAGVAEELRRRRRGLEAAEVDHHLELLVHGIGAIHVLRAERALLHLLEAEREDAVGEAALDELLRHEERRRAGRAVVVHVVDGDAGAAELVDSALAAGRIAEAVPDGRL